MAGVRWSRRAGTRNRTSPPPCNFKHCGAESRRGDPLQRLDPILSQLLTHSGAVRVPNGSFRGDGGTTGKLKKLDLLLDCD
jgi:hypothetical protein